MLRWLNGFVMGTLLGMCINLILVLTICILDKSEKIQIEKDKKECYRKFYKKGGDITWQQVSYS